MDKIKSKFKGMVVILLWYVCLVIVGAIVLAPLLYFKNIGYGTEALAVYVALLVLGTAWLLSGEGVTGG